MREGARAGADGEHGHRVTLSRLQLIEAAVEVLRRGRQLEDGVVGDEQDLFDLAPEWSIPVLRDGNG